MQKGKGGFFEFEGDESHIIERYNKIRRNFPQTEERLIFGMIPLSNPKDLLKDIFTQTKGCPVLIIDPVKFFIPGDYLKPKEASLFIRHFKEMLNNNKVSMITLPIRKPNENSLIQPGDVYNMKGATEYADSATSVLLLEKTPHSHDKSDKATLYFAKHRIASRELKPIDLNLNRNKCLFESISEIVTDETND